MDMINPHCGVERDPRGVVRLTICNAGPLNILNSTVIAGAREGLETLAKDSAHPCNPVIVYAARLQIPQCII